MWSIIALSALFLFAYMSFKKSIKNQENDRTLTSTEPLPTIKYGKRHINVENELITQHNIQKTNEYKSVSRDYAYNNHFKIYYGRYDDISPSEAKRRVERMQNSPREWDSDKYHDLQNRAFSKRNKERLNIVESLDGEELRQFFNEIFSDTYDYITYKVMKAVFEKLSIHDEPFLLEELETLQPSKVSSWLSEKKSTGHFFTEKVYDEAWRLRQYYLNNWYKK